MKESARVCVRVSVRVLGTQETRYRLRINVFILLFSTAHLANIHTVTKRKDRLVSFTFQSLFVCFVLFFFPHLKRPRLLVHRLELLQQLSEFALHVARHQTADLWKAKEKKNEQEEQDEEEEEEERRRRRK